MFFKKLVLRKWANEVNWCTILGKRWAFFHIELAHGNSEKLFLWQKCGDSPRDFILLFQLKWQTKLIAVQSWAKRFHFFFELHQANYTEQARGEGRGTGIYIYKFKLKFQSLSKINMSNYIFNFKKTYISVVGTLTFKNDKLNFQYSFQSGSA